MKDIVEWWKEHFEDLLNSANMSSTQEAELEDLEVWHLE